MMKRLFLLMALLPVFVPQQVLAGAPKCDTVWVAEFGVRPYSYQNAAEGLQQALAACRERNAGVLAFETGRYDIWPEGAQRREWFVSNTSTEQECPSKIKTIGMLIEDMEGLTVEGNGSTLMFHGKMITVAVAHSRNITLKGLHIDFERPGMSEMTYLPSPEGSATLRFHRDVRYEIDPSGHIHLFGEGWRTNITHCIDYDPVTLRSVYSRDWQLLASSRAVETEPGIVRFDTPEGFVPAVGHTLSVRDIIRDHVGVFLYESSDVMLQSVDVHYMHGLGIVSQYTRNITMQNVNCRPREGSGRLIASSADFMHFSGCSGRIRILDCNFAGAHDDPVNVHGTNLRAVGQPAANSLVLRFMHGQSYGFRAFSEGDSVAFVRASTMERYAGASVREVKRISDRLVEVTFDRNIPDGLHLDSDCVENITCTPELEIRRCRFERTNTRGTLVTTPRKVVIADNVYCKTGMCAILIEADASGWYESGPVCDVLIENNTFVDCGYLGGPAHAVIGLNPSNRKVDADHPVHRNVRILNNRFITHGNPLLYAKSTAGLRFENNDIVVGPPDGNIATDDEFIAAAFAGGNRADLGSPDSLFIIEGCKNPSIRRNRLVK